MDRIEIKAYAKVNLSIDIIGRRPDSYHDVLMVLHRIDLWDKVTISRQNQNKPASISLSSDDNQIPLDESNIAFKAASLMKKNFFDEDESSIFIHIEKKIPIAAGLAGGSADAAAVLHGLNILFDLDLSIRELMKLGMELGADVPFCIMSQAADNMDLNPTNEKLSICALAEGIGEILTPLPALKAYAVLLKPDISVSTAEIYRSLDLEGINKRPDTESLIQGLKNNDLSKIINSMHNVLEEVCVKKYPETEIIKQWLDRESEGCKVMMSGSGPTLFVLTQDESQAARILNRCTSKNGGYQVHLTSLS